MSGAAQQVPKFSDVRELAILLANLLDTAQQLPRGPERTAAFEEIRDFQRRLGTFLRDEKKEAALINQEARYRENVSPNGEVMKP
jgi:hypothetical protein